MIDLHCHLLPGIDDGPETAAGSLALARAAVASGISTIVATPHVSPRYPNTPETIGEAFEQMRTRLAEAEIPLRLARGAEVSMSRVGDLEAQELGRLHLGGGGWLLLEPPFSPTAGGLEMIVGELRRRGHRIVLAHPERCPALHRDPDLLRDFVAAGVLTSVTAGSLVGRFGERVRAFALQLAREGLMHNVASDAHDEHGRAPGIAAELQSAGLAELGEWLTVAVPEAILGDAATVPPRPRVALGTPAREEKRSRWRRRRRAASQQEPPPG